MPPELSLVIPAYNESRNLPLVLDRAAQALTGLAIELVIVDNGSTDNSPEVLRNLLPRYPFARSVRVEKNQGYGFGILSGLRACNSPILAWTHADLQTDPADACRGLELFRRAADPSRLFVKGSRCGRPFADVVFTAGMGVFESVLMRQPLWDINAQPTMFPRVFFDSWRTPPNDFSLDLFAFYTARHLGLRIERFPVRFGDRAHGISHWNVNWRAKAKFIRRTIDYSFRLRKGLSDAHYPA